MFAEHRRPLAALGRDVNADATLEECHRAASAKDPSGAAAFARWSPSPQVRRAGAQPLRRAAAPARLSDAQAAGELARLAEQVRAGA